MIKTQVLLTEEQARALRRLAAERGVSMAELIRQGVGRVLEERGEADKWARARAAAGRFHSGYPDLGLRHDDYLAEADAQ